MERKIGEIFEYNGEWYQCIRFPNENCIHCDMNFGGECPIPIKECTGIYRTDKKNVIFKKLEKVGEPFTYYFPSGRITCFQRYKIFNKSYSHNTEHIMCDFDEDGIVSLEIKQNKEDMGKNKVNLKPFNLEEAKSGKPVCTRDRRDVRIICFDREGAYPIVALVKDSVTEENTYLYDNDGKCASSLCKSSLDLMMVSVEHYGWINIHKDSITKACWITPIIFSTKQEAKQEDKTGCIIDTIRIQWRDD